MRIDGVCGWGREGGGQGVAGKGGLLRWGNR